MRKSKLNKHQIHTLTLGAILTAMVIVLQTLGQFIRFGPFSISLVLIPIVIGAAMCGPKISTWLGFIFGVAVLMTDASVFLAISVPGTVITVLLKGMAAGFVAGIICKALENKSRAKAKKANRTIAVILAAIACPIVNTGVFLLGCVVFFFDTIKEWGAGYDNVFAYLIFGMIGINFLVEMGINIFLSPVVVKLLNVGKRIK